MKNLILLIQYIFFKKLLKSKDKLVLRVMWYRKQNKALRKELEHMTYQRDHFRTKSRDLRKTLFSEMGSNRQTQQNHQ